MQTDWPPLAQAAWFREIRDFTSPDGLSVELWRDGQLVERRNAGGRNFSWPDAGECDMSDVAQALLQLLRGDKWSAKEIADAMSEYGLATSRRRVDLLRGRDKEPPHASELVVLINAVMTAYAREAPE